MPIGALKVTVKETVKLPLLVSCAGIIKVEETIIKFECEILVLIQKHYQNFSNFFIQGPVHTYPDIFENTSFYPY